MAELSNNGWRRGLDFVAGFAMLLRILRKKSKIHHGDTETRRR